MFEDIKYKIIEILIRLPIILISLTVHEVAHGYTSYKLGDPTARNFGRLTLNPLKHIDPIGTLCLIFFGFGWAKPVPVNTRYYKKPRRDMALTAAAGPASNLLLGFLGIAILYLVSFIINAIPPQNELTGRIAYVVILFFYVFYQLNFALMLFNLIPIPPLDGSRIAFIFLPDKIYFFLLQYERYISIVFFLLMMFTDIFSGLFGGFFSLTDRLLPTIVKLFLGVGI